MKQLQLSGMILDFFKSHLGDSKMTPPGRSHAMVGPTQEIQPHSEMGGHLQRAPDVLP